MNAYLWHRATTHERPAAWTYQHAGKSIYVPRRLIATSPPPRYLTDAQVADLRAAAKMLATREQCN